MDHITYAETRTREQLDQLLHYAHPIPVRHGFTDDYVARHYPGWSFNQLMKILDDAGIVDRLHMAPDDVQLDRLVAATGVNRIPQPPVCSPDVDTFDFTDAEHWRIHWRNGDTTTHCGPADHGRSGCTSARSGTRRALLSSSTRAAKSPTAPDHSSPSRKEQPSPSSGRGIDEGTRFSIRRCVM